MNSTTLMTFNNEAFEAHLKQCAHFPEWLIELKRKHWQDFTTLPMPKRTDEKWRFTKTQNLTVEGFSPMSQAPAEAKAALRQHLELSPNVCARIAFVDNQLVARGTALPQGVQIMDFEETLQENPECFQTYLEGRHASLGMDKFFALHMAFLSNGLMISIDKNVELQQPIEVHYLNYCADTLLRPHTAIMTADNAKATILEYHGCLGQGARNCLSIGVGTAVAGPGSTLKRHVIQDHCELAHVYQNEEATCERDAYLDNLQVNLGGAYARFEGHAIAAGSGADVHLYSLAAPNKEQAYDQRTLQTHKAPHARSDLLFKNALLDKSQTIFSGLIIVEENAQQTDAYQTNNNLLLSPTAEANSLPGLEIEANDVKCSHGATTGQISPEELFYLNARGIPKRTAFELLVAGFFEEILGKIDDKEAHDLLADKLNRKFAHS
jgi:Fe-S cluster assembly protein SufD